MQCLITSNHYIICVYKQTNISKIERTTQVLNVNTIDLLDKQLTVSIFIFECLTYLSILDANRTDHTENMSKHVSQEPVMHCKLLSFVAVFEKICISQYQTTYTNVTKHVGLK